MLTKQNFIDFLKENNAFNAFQRNCINFGTSLTNLWDTLEKIEAGSKDIIGLSFPWDKTPEGAIYWININDKWIDFVKTKPKTPVYDPAYTEVEVARVFAPKLTREDKDNLEKLLKEKHPNINGCKKEGDYLIGYTRKITGLIERK